MSELNSTGYYKVREQKERSLAEAATDPAIAAIHTDMANRYAALVAKTDASNRPRLRIAQDA